MAVDRFLKEHPNVKRIISGFDKDLAGELYSRMLFDMYSCAGYICGREAPMEKD